MKATLIDGAAIARDIRAEVTAGTEEIRERHGVKPGLAVVIVGEDPASVVYVRNKQKAAGDAGMASESVHLPADARQEDILEAIDGLNRAQHIHGVLVQLPLPDHIDENIVLEAVKPGKDVDGLHPFNMGLLMAGRPRFVPATVAGAQEMLLRSGHDPAGKHVVVCGRSNIVGKPAALLFMQRLEGSNATVTVCHTRTRDIASITRQADILIAAVGRPRFVTADMVKDGVVVVDVGTNRVDDPDRERGYRLVGDVDFGPVSEKAAAITPVPGGVGPMTIAMLLHNTLKATRLSIHPELR